jgi:hypothetical protein
MLSVFVISFFTACSFDDSNNNDNNEYDYINSAVYPVSIEYRCCIKGSSNECMQSYGYRFLGVSPETSANQQVALDYLNICQNVVEGTAADLYSCYTSASGYNYKWFTVKIESYKDLCSYTAVSGRLAE